MLRESFWDEAARAATERWHVIKAAADASESVAASLQGYRGGELETMLAEAVFGLEAVYGNLLGEASDRGGEFRVWAARAGEAKIDG